MIVRHATHRRNIVNIRRRGLLANMSTGRLKAVWVHPEGKTVWALDHVAKRHGWELGDLVVIVLDVPAEWLRWRQEQIAWCMSDIPPECIVSVKRVSFALEDC